ncbi:MAG: ABC transporter permease, partial [Cytophagales bacterium]|nr:ABC transporter permease [Cytophagales bacterium]
MKTERKIVVEISPRNNWWNLSLKEIWGYRDLIALFVRRDFVAYYKQTILGPIWYVLQPLLMTFIFFVIFNRIAGISTDGVTPALFYMSGLVIWNYFSQCFTAISNTFIKNSNIYGKVYFPRLVIPISNVISNFISFGFQFSLLVVMILIYRYQILWDMSLLRLLW